MGWLTQNSVAQLLERRSVGEPIGLEDGNSIPIFTKVRIQVITVIYLARKGVFSIFRDNEEEGGW